MMRWAARARAGHIAPAAALLFAVALAVSCVGVALAQSRRAASTAEYPLIGDEGQRLPNHTVRLLGPVDRLPGVVVVGNPKGKQTLVEFYDLNCPFCRLAAADLGDMLNNDHELRLVLVPYPILGVPSIGAARVELAVAKIGTPEQFYAFHRKVFAQRGTTDGQRALEIAAGLGLNKQHLLALGDSNEITETMKNLVNLGTSLGLEATPSFIAGNLAILGYPGPHALSAIASAVGTCGKVAC
jgi:protein-disulfide isomerase